MRITDLIDRRSIDLNAAPKTKAEALNRLGELMAKSEKITDKEAYVKGLFKREEESTTAVGEGIAIPHYKGSAVTGPCIAAMVVKNGVDFDSVDGKPVTLIFALAAPDVKENLHLDMLSKFSVMMMNEDFTDNLLKAKTVDEFLAVIDKADKSESSQTKAMVNSSVKILAVTSCPTGIAHTYMAEEGLYKAAERAGCAMKVETRGSGGAKNVLTNEEIAAADCIIIAADAKVPMERFDGKKVISVPVSDGISKADDLVKKAISGNVPVYHSEGSAEEKGDSFKGSETAGQKIYKHLMSGVSHMLPFVIGGGILIAIAFLLDDFEVNPSGFGTNTPLAAFFKKIGETAFGLMLPMLAGYIAYSIADRPGLAVGFVGGMFAANGNPLLEFPVMNTGIQGYLQNTVFSSSGSTVSGFLGALAAGFIAGYIVLLLKKLFAGLPGSMDGIKPILLYPLCGVFLIGLLMLLIFNPIIGVINTALANFLNSLGSVSKILLGIVLGGMMAIDMGGPINKAAYVFGTAAISTAAATGDSTGYAIMAAVMVGGMVPPIGIALATTFFKNRFTRAERQTTLSNYIMGACFITEGAIPFAASDPLHVIPATAIGSAVAGALSMLFGCTLMAPHGGIFVFAVVGNWLMYLAALAIGALITMLLLGLLKKRID